VEMNIEAFPTKGFTSKSIDETVVAMRKWADSSKRYYVMHGGVAITPKKRFESDRTILLVHLTTNPEQVVDLSDKMTIEGIVFPVEHFFVRYTPDLTILRIPEPTPMEIAETHKYSEFAKVKLKAILTGRPIPIPLEL